MKSLGVATVPLVTSAITEAQICQLFAPSVTTDQSLKLTAVYNAQKAHFRLSAAFRTTWGAWNVHGVAPVKRRDSKMLL